MARILLIDDEGVVRGALKAVLEQRGHRVAAAADGPAGLALFKEAPPDLVILDRDLPGMTGSEVLKALRGENRDVRVMVLTGHPGAPGEEKYRALGVSRFFSKGIGIEVLLKIIEKELDGAEPKAEARRILVVDDDPSIRSLLRRFLGEKGYRVETAGGAEEALGLLPGLRPHLILLDLEMPEIGGLEVLRRLRRAKDETAVMIITGSDDIAKARECMALGACDYIVKPFNLEYLELSVWAKILTAAP